MRLTAPLFAVLGHEISGRDLILLAGGVFLIWKRTHEIHERLEGGAAVQQTGRQIVLRALRSSVTTPDAPNNSGSRPNAPAMIADAG
jgi:predicted tellurium resistance membrane protein TerC